MDMKSLLKHIKVGLLTPPQLKDDGDFASNTYIDAADCDALLILAIMGATDIAAGSTDEATPMYLEECDTTGGTYTKITGSDLSAVMGAGDDNKFFGWFIDRTTTRKRYIEVNAPHAGNGAAGVNMTIIAIKSPTHVLPVSATEMGLAELVSV